MNLNKLYILRVWKQNLISQSIINEIRFNKILIS